MIVEQKRILGIIPISKPRTVEPGSQIPLKYKLSVGQDITPIIKVLKLLEVLDGENVKLYDLLKQITYENDTPQEINGMRLHTSGFIQNVYKYVPPKKNQ